jgi:hypothetical protein
MNFIIYCKYLSHANALFLFYKIGYGSAVTGLEYSNFLTSIRIPEYLSYVTNGAYSHPDEAKKTETWTKEDL